MVKYWFRFVIHDEIESLLNKIDFRTRIFKIFNQEFIVYDASVIYLFS